MKYAFPEHFWWGSASSALQTEGDSLQGGKSPTIWDTWYANEPWRFHQQVGPQETSTFYRNWRQDIALLKQLNHNSFRTSLSWSRLLPDGTGEVNPQAVAFYNNVIDELLSQGIKPFITLFHLICRWRCKRRAAGKTVRWSRPLAAMRRSVLSCLATG